MKESNEERASILDIFIGILLLGAMVWGAIDIESNSLVYEIAFYVYLVFVLIWFICLALDLKHVNQAFPRLHHKLLALVYAIICAMVVSVFFVLIVGGILSCLELIITASMSAQVSNQKTATGFAICCLISLILFQLKTRHLFVYGFLEMVTGITLIFYKLHSEFDQNGHLSVEVYITVLSVGVFFIALGLENLYKGKEADSVVPLIKKAWIVIKKENISFK